MIPGNRALLRFTIPMAFAILVCFPALLSTAVQKPEGEKLEQVEEHTEKVSPKLRDNNKDGVEDKKSTKPSGDEAELEDKTEIDAFARLAALNNVEELKKMLKENPDLRFQVNSNGFTPLHCAAMAGKLEAVKLLMVRMGDPESKQKTYKGKPLQYAAHRGHVEVVEFMIDAGADVDSTDTNKRTPLIWAVMGERIEVVKALLENDADIQAANLGGWTPLHYAAQTGNKEIFDLLVEKGADENAANVQGKTPDQIPVKKKRLPPATRRIEVL